MFLAGLHVAIIGRVATADMAMVFFFMVALWSGWQLTRPERSSRLLWWWIFYVALALGFLAKGPVAWLPFGGLLLARLWRKDSFHLPLLDTLLGLALTVVLTLLWGLPAQELTQGQYFKVGVGEHVIHRSTGVNDGHGLQGVGGFLLTLPLYFLTFLVSFLPWTIHEPEGLEPWFGQLRRRGRWWSAAATGLRWAFFLFHIPLRIRRWWPERGRDELGWYLLLQAFVVFAVFSCVRTKLPHYTLPAFPCIALWLALQLRTEAAAVDWFQKRLRFMAVAVLVLMVGGGLVVRQQFLTENLWRAVRPHMQPGTKVGCYGFTESSLVWKFRGITTNLVTLGEAKDADFFLTNPPPSILVIPTRELGSLMDTNGLLLQVHGLDLVRFRRWDLTAIVR
jgi:4-amino-4-deoxy-L-arabinose transferase-like glycosyltransferase